MIDSWFETSRFKGPIFLPCKHAERAKLVSVTNSGGKGLKERASECVSGISTNQIQCPSKQGKPQRDIRADISSADAVMA